jgi:hypothetical protein
VVAWGLWAVTLGLSFVSLGLVAATGGTDGSRLSLSFVATWFGALVAFQSFATVGALVASRVPGNPIGRLY